MSLYFNVASPASPTSVGMVDLIHVEREGFRSPRISLPLVGLELDLNLC